MINLKTYVLVQMEINFAKENTKFTDVLTKEIFENGQEY